MSSPPKQRMYVYAGHLRAKLTQASSWPRQKIAALEGWPRPGAQCSPSASSAIIQMRTGETPSEFRRRLRAVG